MSSPYFAPSLIGQATVPEESTKQPSEKALGKRPMSAAQLAVYNAKLPRVANYDSDDEHPLHQPPLPGGEPRVPMQPVHPLGGGPRNQGRHPNVVINLTDTFADDIVDELYADDDEGRPRTPVHTNRRRRANFELFGSDSETDEPDPDADTPLRMQDASERVQDPFNPDLTCTAAERDAILEGEQEWRMAHNVPPLVRDPLDPEHWVDPLELGIVEEASVEVEETD